MSTAQHGEFVKVDVVHAIVGVVNVIQRGQICGAVGLEAVQRGGARIVAVQQMLLCCIAIKRNICDLIQTASLFVN